MLARPGCCRASRAIDSIDCNALIALQKQPAVHAWIRARIVFLNEAYQRVFVRPVDLEGVGSRVLLALEGRSDAEIEAILVQDKKDGAT